LSKCQVSFFLFCPSVSFTYFKNKKYLKKNLTKIKKNVILFAVVCSGIANDKIKISVLIRKKIRVIL